MRKRPGSLRAHRWFGVQDLRSFGHRSRLRQIGYDAEDRRGKPDLAPRRPERAVHGPKQ